MKYPCRKQARKIYRTENGGLKRLVLRFLSQPSRIGTRRMDEHERC